ncbi:UDP-N-acetylmuramoyl-L-alanyl-D-glutamate--2,6-diaminopimelate ligase [Candidatus Saccharibacteria bacterium]|nr:UDP-N-acetylmuramoyl-L-alanyl-D-glutamate--2,6-diaminopimelate ligase [Candidatus Saccharibacteria bacterium]
MKKLVKKLIPTQLFRAIEPTGHLLEAMAVSARYGFPAKGLHVIGVTGTNGKTTTCFMLHRMLVEAGYNVALMTTVAYGVGDNIKPQIAHMTTLSAPQLNRRIKELRDGGAEWLILETTSHALAQHRVWGVPYEIAVMTNVTHEHLDYHGTFERYLDAKAELFRLANKRGGFGVINAEDPNATKFVDAIAQSSTYGIAKGDVQAQNINMRTDGSTYTAVVGENNYDIRCNIPGEFNISNSLATVTVGRHLGLSKEQIEQGIAHLKGVEGRMTTVDEGQPFSVIIDFAHTPDSFERLLSDIRTNTNGKVVALFGSAGRRDESKRWKQGEIAGKYCDELVLTEEDDRDIDGNLILNQIAEGAERSGKTKEKDLFLIPDRTKAIQFAMTRVSSSDDVIILLGKGHEKTIERKLGSGGQKDASGLWEIHTWDEASTAIAAIQALN